MLQALESWFKSLFFKPTLDEAIRSKLEMNEQLIEQNVRTASPDEAKAAIIRSIKELNELDTTRVRCCMMIVVMNDLTKPKEEGKEHVEVKQYHIGSPSEINNMMLMTLSSLREMKETPTDGTTKH